MLESFEVGEGVWRLVVCVTWDELVAPPPFSALSFSVSKLWDW